MKKNDSSNKDELASFNISEYLLKISDLAYDEEVKRGISLENLSGQLVTFNSIIIGFMLIRFDEINSEHRFLVIMVFLSMSSALLSLARFKYKTTALPADVFTKVDMFRSKLEHKDNLIRSYVDQINTIVKSMKDKNDKVVRITFVSMISFFVALLFLCVSIIL